LDSVFIINTMKRTCLQKSITANEQTTCEFHPDKIYFKGQPLGPEEILHVKSFARIKSKLFILSLFILSACTIKTPKYIFNEGYVYGTIYHLTYESPEGKDWHNEIKDEFKRLDHSFSTFNKESVISKINRNESAQTDTLFNNVFNRSVEIWQSSGGAFDPTVAPLVNAWGFGFKNAENISNKLIDSLLTFVGMNKVRLSNDQIEKSDDRVMLDFSAIAKGYTVDIIAEWLIHKGCKNVMVEIGGEVRASGVNPKGNVWRIGINEPNENEPITPNDFQAIILLPEKSVATSGNYRNFYEKDGKKYAHTINPSTGYPVEHNLLSVTVVADDCMTADGWATAFMVLGLDQAYTLANSLKGIEAFFIYNDENGMHQIRQTNGFSKFLIE